ncbi:alpha/beta hydrolase [bacterium]|nr:alpha/beta hydrolase [bacterium]
MNWRFSWLPKIGVGIILIGMLLMILAPLLRRLIYFPQITKANVQQFIQSRGFKAWDTRGYLRIPINPKKLIIIFHGNAGTAADRFYMAMGFMDDNTVVYLHEYPAYGQRVGKPSEDTLIKSAIEDVRALKERYPQLPFTYLGESIGTGVACGVAEALLPQHLILVSPFSSLIDAAHYHYPWLPVRLLLPDTYQSLERLKKISVPLLIVHGSQDSIIPFDLGKKLYESYNGPKKLLVLEGYDHNNLPWDDVTGLMWNTLNNWTR